MFIRFECVILLQAFFHLIRNCGITTLDLPENILYTVTEVVAETARQRETETGIDVENETKTEM